MGKNIIIISMLILSFASYAKRNNIDLEKPKLEKKVINAKNEQKLKLDHSSLTYYSIMVTDVDGKPKAIQKLTGDGGIFFYDLSGKLLNSVPTAPDKDIKNELAELAIATEKTMALIDKINNNSNPENPGDPKDYGKSDYNFLGRYEPAASIFSNPDGYSLRDYAAFSKGDPTTTSDPSNYVDVLK